MEKTKERNKKMGSSAYFVHHMLYSRHHPPTCDSLQRAACTGAESVKMLASLDTPFGLLAKQLTMEKLISAYERVLCSITSKRQQRKKSQIGKN